MDDFSKMLFDYGKALSKQYSPAERQRMQEGCAYCRMVPGTNNPALCLCQMDCGREVCGRVASGEPAPAPNDLMPWNTYYLTAEDRDPAMQRRRAELRARIAKDKADGGR